MGNGRRADADEIDASEQLAPVGDGGHAVRGKRGAAHFGARVGDGEELDAVDMAILGGMVTAKRAGADHGSLKQALVADAEWGQTDSLRKYSDIRSVRGSPSDS